MRKILITPLLAVLTAAVLFGFTACADADVVGRISVTSFDAVLKQSDIKTDERYGGWSLTAPDQSARFIWSSDFKGSESRDVMMEVDAKPFVDAGLDTAKLPAGMVVDGKIIVGLDLGDTPFPDSAKETALASYEQLVKLSRETVGYHANLDHYGVDVGNGNKFEWAKDMAKNDKDIVFVLDPGVLTAAGVDPARVAGWVFAGVEVMDAAGRPVTVDKFLKPFEIG